MPTGLLIGRFQPFHNGHMAIIKQMFDKCDEVIIVIGSAEKSHTKYNPFTASERYQMIHESIKEDEFLKHGLSKIHIIPIQDIDRYILYAKHIESLVPPFDVIYTCNPVIEMLFTDYKIVAPEITYMNDTNRISGTIIRKGTKHIKDEYWKGLLPTGTLKIMDKINGVDRLNNIARSD